jgi:dCMP deaminase
MEKIPSGTQQEKCRAVHAEQNAIIQAAIHGVNVSGATIYCTHQPCILCTKMIINSNIKRVVYATLYHDTDWFCCKNNFTAFLGYSVCFLHYY